MCNLPDMKEREYAIAGPFYSHPYGGIGRDIPVTREGFVRFFELTEYDCAVAEAFADGGKIYNGFPDDWTELLGYIVHEHGKLKYVISVVSKDHSRVSELLQIAPYLWEGNDDCDPHGIERPVIDDDVSEKHIWYPTVIEDQGAIIWGDYSGPPELY